MCCRRRDQFVKELHFFNRWPPLPTNSFPMLWRREAGDRQAPNRSKYIRAMQDQDVHLPHSFAMLDATPEYLFNAWSPARIKAAVPHARIVLVLRVRLHTHTASFVCCQSARFSQADLTVIVSQTPTLWRQCSIARSFVALHIQHKRNHRHARTPEHMSRRPVCLPCGMLHPHVYEQQS